MTLAVAVAIAWPATTGAVPVHLWQLKGDALLVVPALFVIWLVLAELQQASISCYAHNQPLLRHQGHQNCPFACSCGKKDFFLSQFTERV